MCTDLILWAVPLTKALAWFWAPYVGCPLQRSFATLYIVSFNVIMIFFYLTCDLKSAVLRSINKRVATVSYSSDYFPRETSQPSLVHSNQLQDILSKLNK